MLTLTLIASIIIIIILAEIMPIFNIQQIVHILYSFVLSSTKADRQQSTIDTSTTHFRCTFLFVRRTIYAFICAIFILEITHLLHPHHYHRQSHGRKCNFN